METLQRHGQVHTLCQILLTSSEVELMETRPSPGLLKGWWLLTSSEVELMETIRFVKLLL